MLLLGVLAMALAVILTLRETPAARLLHALLVERPAAWLAKLSPTKVIIQGGLLGAVALLLFLTRGSELGPMIAQALPELASWLIAIDAITMLEVALAIWLVATNARVRVAFRQARLAAWRWAVRCVAGVRAHARTLARERALRMPARRAQRPSPDDDERAGESFAFA